MYNKKNLAVIFIFIIIFAAVLVSALTARTDADAAQISKEDDKVESSYFKGVHYFKILDQKPQAELEAEFLDIRENTFLSFLKPEGIFIHNENKINYSAKSGNMDAAKSDLTLEGEVRIKDANSRYESEFFHYDGRLEVMKARNNVKSLIIDETTKDRLKISSKEMVSWLQQKRVELRGGVQGEVQRKRKYEGKLEFSSEEMSLDQQESFMKLDNDVKIRQNKMHLRAGNAEIFLENFNKKLKYYALYDDVRLEEKLQLKSGVFQTRKAFAEKLEAHQGTGKLILTGAPRVEQGSDIIKGYQITLREAVEMIEVDDSQSSFKLKRDK
ncbi:MAG: LptA/OstA family protein [Bdellovibrionota bacterium]|nr:LptA/OstA family protein [Bdellovibrionota bacterium]